MSRNDLRNDESSRQRSAVFPRFLFNAVEHAFQSFQAIKIEPENGITGNLQALQDSKIDGALGDSDVATFCKYRDYARDCRKSMGVEN